MSEIRNAMLSHNNASGYNRSNANELDVGYDTDSIAIFEIDKSFTDFLLCQICFSKSKHSSNQTCRNEQRCERVRLLQQAVLQTLHRELAGPEQRLPCVPQRHQDQGCVSGCQGDHPLVQDPVLLLPKCVPDIRDREARVAVRQGHVRQSALQEAPPQSEVLPGRHLGRQTVRLQRHLRTDGKVRETPQEERLLRLPEVCPGHSL